MSLPEVLLWRELRARPGGFKFRRQHPAGPYVLDFYSEQARLAIEVDGMAHDMGNEPQRDMARDQWLAGRGIGVLRIPARTVLEDLEGAAAAILVRCSAAGTPPPPFGRSPSPSGRI